MISMTYPIGEYIGATIAYLERELSEGDPDDLRPLHKLALVSEAYRNLSMGGLEGFHADYHRGYQGVLADLLYADAQRQAKFERERERAAKSSDALPDIDPTP